ncbi:hypothetical protein ABZV14_26155 [Streptosporangium canum]|uniref:hypothetical protein n=1 Tax=Streptosporangium canum TaxID=324952 RepID=UPI0033A017C4
MKRALAWLMAYRRLARDYERQPPTSEAMIRWAVINMLAHALPEGIPYSDPDPAHSNEPAEPNDHLSNTHSSAPFNVVRRVTRFAWSPQDKGFTRAS